MEFVALYNEKRKLAPEEENTHAFQDSKHFCHLLKVTKRRSKDRGNKKRKLRH